MFKRFFSLSPSPSGPSPAPGAFAAGTFAAVKRKKACVLPLCRIDTQLFHAQVRDGNQTERTESCLSEFTPRKGDQGYVGTHGSYDTSDESPRDEFSPRCPCVRRVVASVDRAVVPGTHFLG